MSRGWTAFALCVAAVVAPDVARAAPADSVVVAPMYDGSETHLLGSFATERFSVSALWVWLERAGLAVSVGF
jgi:hypothetical protein